MDRTVNVMAATSRYVPEPPTVLDCALANAVKVRDASQAVDTEVLALVQRMAWPTNESAGKALHLVQRLVNSSSRLQTACKEAEQAAMQAVNEHRADRQVAIEAANLKERALEKRIAVQSQVWRREVRSMEQQHHAEMLAARRTWTGELQQQRSQAVITSARLRNEAAEHNASIASLEEQLSALQTELARTTAEGHEALEAVRAEASAQRGASRVLDTQQAARLSHAVQGSSAEMMSLRHALAAAEADRDRLAEQCVKHEVAYVALTARLEDANARHVQETMRLHHKIDRLRGNQGGAGTFNALLRRPDRRSGRFDREQLEREASLIDSAIVAAEFDSQRFEPPRPRLARQASSRQGSMRFSLAVDAAAAVDARAAAEARAPSRGRVHEDNEEDNGRDEAADSDDAEPETPGAPRAATSSARVRPGTAPPERLEMAPAEQGPRPVSARNPISRSLDEALSDE